MEPSLNGLPRVILDTTRHLLVTEGYANLSMRKIARAIGYSATSIYLYFESKDHLVHALIDEGMERLYQALEAAAGLHPADPVMRLEAIARAYIGFGLDNPEYYEVMYQLHPETMARYPAALYRRALRNLDLIASTIAEAVAQGTMQVASAWVSGNAVWTALHGVVALVNAERIHVRIDRPQLIETVISQTLRGLTGAPA
jgi:AcrR family transcriptional regulator